MSKVWRRLQRVGKTAYKFEFTIKVHTVTLECVSGWYAVIFYYISNI